MTDYSWRKVIKDKQSCCYKNSVKTKYVEGKTFVQPSHRTVWSSQLVKRSGSSSMTQKRNVKVSNGKVKLPILRSCSDRRSKPRRCAFFFWISKELVITNLFLANSKWSVVMQRLRQNSVWFYNQHTRQLVVPQEKLPSSKNWNFIKWVFVFSLLTLRAMWWQELRKFHETFSNHASRHGRPNVTCSQVRTQDGHIHRWLAILFRTIWLAVGLMYRAKVSWKSRKKTKPYMHRH